MSYILDALQKSEQDRQNQQTPSLTNQYDTQSLTPLQKPRLIWWVVAGLAALLIALSAAFVFWFLQPAKPTAYTPAAIARVSPAELPLPQPDTQPATPPATPEAHAPAPPKAQPIPETKATSESQPTSEANWESATQQPPEQPAAKTEPLDPRIAELYSSPPAVEPEFVYADDNRYQLAADDTPTALPAKAEPSAQAIENAPSPKAPEPAAPRISQPPVTAGSINPTTTAPTTEQESATIVASDNAGGVVEGGFMSIEQLPDTIKSEIPAIRYVAHVYSGQNKAALPF